MTNDYERYNFWHKELDQFANEEGSLTSILPVENEIQIVNNWSTEFYLDGSVNGFNNDLFYLKDEVVENKDKS
jgi:hypothetical protein